MTSPESTPAGAGAKSDTTLAKMTITQLREEVMRLNREHAKAAVLACSVVLTAIQRRFPGSLESAVEETAKAVQMRPERVWALLRSETLTRGPISRSFTSKNQRSLLAEAERVLMVCGGPGNEDFNAYQMFMHRVEDITAQRERAMDAHEQATAAEKAEKAKQATPHKRTPRAEPPVVVPDAVVPDAGGRDYKPDPLTADSVPDFVACLGRLHVWAGEPSMRELSRRTQGRIAHSTFSAMLNKAEKLPAQRTVELFVRVLGFGEDEVARWITAWRGLRFQRRICRTGGGTVTRLHRPASSQ